jgi:hypothetical protein
VDSDILQLFINLLKVGAFIALIIALITGIMIGGCIAHV